MLTITTENNRKMSTNVVGDFDWAVNVLGATSTVRVNNVYYVLELKANLLSVGQIV